jgi:hypothetical protein
MTSLLGYVTGTDISHSIVALRHGVSSRARGVPRATVTGGSEVRRAVTWLDSIATCPRAPSRAPRPRPAPGA